MKALTLAAVIALSATGAAALDTNEILTKGIKITEFNTEYDGRDAIKEMLYLYKGLVYYCYVAMPPDRIEIALRCRVDTPIAPLNG